MIYAGVGARKTPDDILLLMYRLGYKLASSGDILRSGGASGADLAFQTGCETWCDENSVSYSNRQEIYLPWDNFNGHTVNEEKGITTELHWMALEIASQNHPNFNTLTETVKKLMSRNTSQILGNGKSTEETELLICWTPDGAKNKTTTSTGGTGQAIRLAIDNNIPILNVYHQTDRLWAEELLSTN